MVRFIAHVKDAYGPSGVVFDDYEAIGVEPFVVIPTLDIVVPPVYLFDVLPRRRFMKAEAELVVCGDCLTEPHSR